MRKETLELSTGGMWLWLLQRVTAVLLLLFLTAHLIATHVLNLGELSYDNVGGRLASGFFVVVDFGLLGAGLFHGLNGLRMVLLDYGFGGRSQSVLSWILLVVGLAAFAGGTWALWPWLTT
ncbi:MAG TPA: succinate dehydrogenase, cytochrome b556 subunit [Thermoleophilia bacterium]|nr:succinate dehydrogenase, cytochrome b556 subunit [Thermoleophilia bacterium]